MGTERGAALLERLRGGDRRSVGRVDEVVDEVLNDSSLLVALFDGMTVEDHVIRMRAADAIEKITAEHTEWLEPFKRRLLEPLAAIDQPEVRWHIAQLLPRPSLTADERSKAVKILPGYLDDWSAIVRSFSLQALADLAVDDAALRQRVLVLLEEAKSSDSPAIRSRARKLLVKLGRS